MASHRTRIATAGFGAALLLVSGLALAADRLERDRAPASSGAPAAPATPGGAPPQTPGAVPDDVLACGGPTRTTILDTVTGQLEAFARDDWDGALDFATASFREGVDADALEQIILEGYPIAADALDATLGACATSGPFAQAEVEVLGDAGRTQRLTYLLAFEDGAWHIAGAGDAQGGAVGPDGEAPTTI